jgi:hypothetical protein
LPLSARPAQAPTPATGLAADLALALRRRLLSAAGLAAGLALRKRRHLDAGLALALRRRHTSPPASRSPADVLGENNHPALSAEALDCSLLALFDKIV